MGVSLELDRLNPEQKEGVLYTGGPLLVLAGAGTGKTRVITYRIAHLISQGVPAERILAVTFTNKAAEEMRRRIEELSPGHGAKVWAHTFHAFASRLIRQHHKLLNLNPYFTIYDQSDQKKLVVDSMRELGLEEQANKASMYVSLISRAKDDLLDAQSYAIYAATATDASRETAARIYLVYQRKLDQAGALDFGDLLLKTCVLLKEHQSIREYYQEYFLHLLVDEYQDTNHAQYVLTKTLAAKHRNICVVGDDDQSVYSWRGANIRNILEFEKDFKQVKTVTLEQNYRSTSKILDAASRVISRNRARKLKTLWTEKGPGESVRVRELPNEMEEAAWVSRSLQSVVACGASLKDIAIFYRTNAQSRSFEEALRRAGTPYRIVGAMRFYERKEIKDALAYARIILNLADSTSLSRIINVPPRGIGKTSLEKISRHADAAGLTLLAVFKEQEKIAGLTPACRRALTEILQVLEELRSQVLELPAAAAMARLLDRSGYWRWLESEVETDPEAASRLDNLQELLNAMKEVEEKAKSQGEVLTLGRYLEAVALQTDLDSYDPQQPCVTLMTVHLAKGLEFPTVFLTGLEEGLFPIGAGNSSQEELEEERRLCYVGMTRARENLILTHAATRRIFGQVYANLPSRFILEAELLGSVPERAYAAGAARSWDPSGNPLGPVDVTAGVSARRLNQVRVGMRVRHPDFGLGQVLDKSGSGETLKVTVSFDSGRTAKLLLRYAPLEAA
ncbi:MAG: UvrD-helicase domain-containing protein [Elusimicrobia bacterium]|nr:UvrD-helicase domain-containing protein [Elusimicrobiota bacterium]